MLAIIIPYYKLSFFKATLNSLALQTDKRFTVYIGDDASPENPITLLENYKDFFKVRYQYFEENLGSVSLVKHWDRCIALTQNEDWIMILGDDDVLGSDVIEKFYNYLEEIDNSQANVVRYATELINEEDNAISKIFEHPKYETAADFLYRKFSGSTRGSLSEYFFKKNTFKRYGFTNYPLAWHSDDMALLESSEEKFIFSINDSLIKIRMSKKSLSGSKDNISEKRYAESLFYLDLVNKKLKLFTKKQRLFLLYRLEEAIKKKRKLNSNEWFLLLRNYSYNFSIFYFFKFLRRFIISLRQ